MFYLYFPPSLYPTFVCFFPVGLSLSLQHFQQVLWVLKLFLSPGLGGVTLTRAVENVVITMKGLQERNIQMLDGTKVENEGKKIN